MTKVSEKWRQDEARKFYCARLANDRTSSEYRQQQQWTRLKNQRARSRSACCCQGQTRTCEIFLRVYDAVATSLKNNVYSFIVLFTIAGYNFLAARIATIFPPAEPLYNNEYWLVGIETHNQIDRVNNYKHKSRIHFNGEKYNVVKNANWFLLQTITKSWINATCVFIDASISFKAKTVTLCYSS